MKKRLSIRFNSQLNYYELWLTKFNPDDFLYPTIYELLLTHSLFKENLNKYATENHPELCSKYI